MIMDEKQKEVYKELEGYVKKGEQGQIEALIKKHGISYFKNFRAHGLGLLFYFMTYQMIDMIKFIVEEGWDVNEVDETGDNLLFFARAFEGNESFVEFLIEKGMNVNHFGGDGYTPILLALEIEVFDLAKKLYQHGADVNVETDEGDDILHYIFAAEDEIIEKEWITMLLNEPERCDEDLLKRLKTLRLKELFV